MEKTQEFKREVKTEVEEVQREEEEKPLQRSRSEHDLAELIREAEDEAASQKQPLNASWKKGTQPHEEIKIQENYFDDEEISLAGRDQPGEQEEVDTSILNQSDVNKFIQNEKFSIEDFKSLDKKSLTAQFNEVADSENEEPSKPKGTHSAEDPNDNSSSINFLFQNAKPGENIRISDIFKRGDSSQANNSSNSFLDASQK